MRGNNMRGTPCLVRVQAATASKAAKKQADEVRKRKAAEKTHKNWPQEGNKRQAVRGQWVGGYTTITRDA